MTPNPFKQVLTLALALLVSGALHAQAEQTPERLLDEPLVEAEADEPGEENDIDESAASREVDFSEENFRRSMELRDQALQRSPDLTTGSYSTGTGLQLLDDLPEASQKHLREQLREVIVQNGPWTPDEAGETYPYVPSAEAMKNPSLRRREDSAWGELVDRYHEREAAIHANAGRSRLATAESPGAPGGEGREESGNTEGQRESGNSEGQDESGNGERQAESGEEAARAARQAALADLIESGDEAGADSGGGPQPPVEQGVQQNALELLTERQQLPAGAAEAMAAGQEQSQEVGMSFDSEGVIAIEDLEKVDLEPRQGREEDE